MMRRQLALLFLLLSSLPLMLHAGGKIRGRVVDKQTRDPLVGANILIAGSSYGAAADVNGEFSFVDLPVGTHTLRASYVGYSPMNLEEVRVFNDLTTEIEFPLEVEAVNIQAITVVAERPLVIKSSTNAVRIANADQIATLPVRSVEEILALMPGVNFQDGQIHIRGGRVDEVGYYLDGFSITDPQSGGQGLSIPTQALEEISVQSAGYEAEYGRANAGIVQQQIRTGGQRFSAFAEYVTDNISLAPKSSWSNGNRRLGAAWYGYTDFNASVSGPVAGDLVKFFGLFHYNYQADQHPQWYPGSTIGGVVNPSTGDSVNFDYPAGIRLNNSLEQYNGTGTVTLDLRPLLLRLSGSYTRSRSFSGGESVPNRGFAGGAFVPGDDLSRVPVTINKDGFGSLKATYFFTPTLFGEISGGWFAYSEKTSDPVLGDNFWAYGDSVANAKEGVIWIRRPGDPIGRYVLPPMRQVYGFSFVPPGLPVATYVKLERSNISMSGSFSAQLDNNHTVKLGGDYQRYTIRNYQLNFPAYLAQYLDQNNALADGDPAKKTLEQFMIQNFRINTYGYDVLGNPNEADDFLGPRHPVFASGYIQDHMEFNDLVLNVGLRYDYINTATYAAVDPNHPELTRDLYTNAINPAGLRKTTPFHSLSPRLGAAYPVSDLTVFHVQYAKLVQQSRLRDVNVGLYSGALFSSATTAIGFDLRPERTTQYEIGFTEQIGEFASFDITGYYKDIRDQIVMHPVQTDRTSPYTSYAVYVNGDFATTKGIELLFAMRRYNRLMVNASLSFQDAQGSGSFPNSNWGTIGAGTDTAFVPYYISPLTYMNTLRGNVSLDYRFAPNDGGPVLSELGASLIISFNSGHPFTRASGSSDEFYARYRVPIEALNASTTPWFFQADLRIDKTFHLTDRLATTVSLYVINLFDTKNVLNVWSRTGSADDDGFLSNPDLSAASIQRYGSRYPDVYRLISLSYSRPGGYSSDFNDPYFYGSPRQIRLGVRLEL
jgi:hypothetical protein